MKKMSSVMFGFSGSAAFRLVLVRVSINCLFRFEALHNLKKLLEQGFIDEQEFTQRKRQLIDTLTNTSLNAAEPENPNITEPASANQASDHEGEEVENEEEEDEEAPKRKIRNIDGGSPTHSPNPRRKRKLPSKKVTLSDEEEEMDPSDPNATYTWSELIEKALTVLGGSRTGHEITEYIEENYPHILTNKTKTWKNSVFGCLSSNARKRWIKEQTVVNGKKRFVWRLNKNDQPTQAEQQLGSPFAAKALSKMRKLNPPKLLNFTTDTSVQPPSQQQPSPLSPSKASLLLLSSLASSSPVPAEGAPKKEEDIVEEFPIHEIEEKHEGHHDESNETAKLVEQSLKNLGGRATGQDIADYIQQHYYDSGNTNKKSLRYSVNAILSSKKHSGLFVKVQTAEKTLWQLNESAAGKAMNQ